MEKFIVGLVGTFGSGCSFIAEHFFKQQGYYYISLSDLLREVYESIYGNQKEISRTALQDFGDQIREEKGSSYLAVKAYEIIEKLPDQHIVIDSIRNPEEINYLKSKFVQFYVFGIYADKETRWERIKSHYAEDVSKFEMDELRDQGEKIVSGQRVTDCFLLADVILRNNEQCYKMDATYRVIEKKLKRYIGLLQRKEMEKIPTACEAMMVMAYANSMRSSCLKRKVGAVIVDESGFVFSSGYNEVPALERPCKKQYGTCYRNFSKQDVIRLFSSEQTELKNKVLSKVKLLEKCRAVHAEENAILNIAKSGSAHALEKATLYTTTYPCHLCANKIAQVGIKKIVYFEPYPGKEAKRTLNQAGVKQEMFEGITHNAYFKVYGEIIL